MIAALTLAWSLSALAAPPQSPPRMLCEVLPPSGSARSVRPSTYLGEAVIYRVTLENVETPKQPELRGFDDFLVEYEGDQSLNSVRIQIFNGQRQQVESFGHLYQWRLTPRREGVLEIPAPRVVVDGELLTGNTVSLEVKPPDQTDLVKLRVSIDRERVYPMQPFVVTLDVLIRELPEGAPQRNQDPLRVTRQNPPRLRVPWVEPPEGLEADGVDKWLGRLMNDQNVGLRINELTRGRDLLSFGFEPNYAVFLPTAEWIREPNAAGEEIRYRRYRLRREFRPMSQGLYSFGPVSLKGRIADRMEAGRLIGEDLHVVSDAANVKVVAPPRAGRPDGFTGAVGRFQVSASIQPERVRVGEPMTLTLDVSGQGTIEDIQAPALDAIEGVAERFKVYEDPTAETRDGRRRFVYSLRPTQAGAMRFPSIPFAYFDVESETYRTVATEALPIEVEEASRIESSDIVTGSAGARSRLEVLEGYFGNDENVTQLVERRLGATSLFTYLAALVVVWIGAAFATARMRRFHENPELRRRRDAAGRARKRLESALASLEAGERDGARQLVEAFGGLLADAAGRSEAAFTQGDVTRLGAELGCDAERLQSVRQLLQSCDAARYGGSQALPPAVSQQARDLFESLLSELKRGGRLK